MSCYRVIFLLYYVVGQRQVPAALSLERDPVPIVQENGWPQYRSGHVLKTLQIPTFDPRPFQPIASRYLSSAPLISGCCIWNTYKQRTGYYLS